MTTRKNNGAARAAHSTQSAGFDVVPATVAADVATWDLSTFGDAITELVKGTGAVTDENYSAVVAYLSEVTASADMLVGGLAYGIRTRTVVGCVDSDSSVGRLASDLVTPADIDRANGDRALAVKRRRVSLSQWATAYGYLVDCQVPVTPATYADARRIFNGGKASRDRFTDVHASTVRGTDEAERVAVFATYAAECGALKYASKVVEVTPTTVTDATPDEATATDEATADEATADEATATRAVWRPDGTDVRAVTVAWVADLADVVKRATDGTDVHVVLNRAEADRVTALIGVLSSLVTTAPATAAR